MQRLLERLEKLTWRLLLALERAEAILGEPLHPEDVLDASEGERDGFERTEAGPEQAE